jgi:cell wall-associated NlpC family hydrolase
MIGSIGVCPLSIIAMRKEPSERSEMVSQLVFGESFTIEESSRDEKWVRITTHFDNYPGWISQNQLEASALPTTGKEELSGVPICKSLIGLVRSDAGYFPVLMGTPLPGLNDQNHMIVGATRYQFEGESVLPGRFNAGIMEVYARFFMGAPYLWGGKTHFGIDCSGYTQQVFRAFGMALPRDAAQQAQEGFHQTIGAIESGDLVFFQNEEGKVVHVGLYFGKNMVYHASGKVRVDFLKEDGLYNAENGLKTHHFHSLRRIRN